MGAVKMKTPWLLTVQDEDHPLCEELSFWPFIVARVRAVLSRMRLLYFLLLALTITIGLFYSAAHSSTFDLRGLTLTLSVSGGVILGALYGPRWWIHVRRRIVGNLYVQPPISVWRTATISGAAVIGVYAIDFGHRMAALPYHVIDAYLVIPALSACLSALLIVVGSLLRQERRSGSIYVIWRQPAEKK